MKLKTEEQAEFNKRVLIILSIGFVVVVIFQAILFMNQSDNQALQLTIEAQQTVVAGLLPTMTYTPSITPSATITPSPTLTFTPRPTITLSPTPSSAYYNYTIDYETQTQSVDWQPSGNYIAFGLHRTWEIVIYDAINRIEVQKLAGLSDRITSIRWSPDGSYLAAVDWNGRILIWNTETWESVNTLRSPTATKLTWSNDGHFLVALGNGTTNLWDVETWTLLFTDTIFSRSSFPNYEPALEPNAERIALIPPQDYFLRLVSLAENGTALAESEILFELELAEVITAVSWSRDGRWLLAGTQRGDIHIFDFVSHRITHSLEAHFGNVLELDWSNDGNYFASLGEDETVNIWTIQTLEQITSLHFTFSIDTEVDSFAWSGDNCFLAAQAYEIQIWYLPELCEQEQE